MLEMVKILPPPKRKTKETIIYKPINIQAAQKRNRTIIPEKKETTKGGSSFVISLI
jgi:hypothetical protein